MKKVLLATTNNDKFNAVSKILKETIFPESEYEIGSLKTYNIELPDEQESGTNIERATKKAINARNYLGNEEFDYIVGLDDAIRIKGVLDPNIKKILNKILYEDYLDCMEEYAFNRAYVFIDKDNNIYTANADIPYYYKPCKDAKIEDFSYPLSVVAYPLGYDKPICYLSEEEEIAYYKKYVEGALKDLNLK